MILKDKRFVLTGIASKRSIAWGIAQSLSEQGAKLVLTYPNDKIKKRVDMAAAEFGAEAVLELDVGDDGHFADLTRSLESIWPEGIDGAVHAIGFAPADQLDGDFTSVTTREGFAVAHDISSYSFIALAKALWSTTWLILKPLKCYVVHKVPYLVKTHHRAQYSFVLLLLVIKIQMTSSKAQLVIMA